MKSILLFFITTALFISCNNTQQGNGTQKLGGDIKIDGSSTVYPITEAIAEEFRAVQPNVKVTVGVSGTGGGFKKFSRGETDVTNASRAIKESEAADCKANNVTFLELSVAYDGLAVVVNPQNDWTTSITVAELKKIWEPEAQGVIKKWNQIRPEWPDAEIHLFGPGVASGTFDYFTEAIVGESGKSRGDFTASEDDNVLVQGIEGDKYGLGFFGVAYFEENKDKLKLVGVDNGSGAILPTLETVRNGTYKPLARPLFIYVNGASEARPEVKEFVKFYLEVVPQLAQEVGYVPLPEEEYVRQTEKFNTFISAIPAAH
ncbi:MAG: PstS family phosphate ABC transporter substrate-binding protein [Chitinophagales bacterium]|nr:PstS family phosphate ABC transporter substrate-binding protein [Chitinophagales bacterium]